MEYRRILQLQVEGMHCTGCETTVARVLKRLDGVRSVASNFSDGTVRVEVTADVSRERMAEVLEKAGYRLKSVGRASAEAGRKTRGALPAGIALVALAAALIFANTVGIGMLPEFTAEMSLGLLFLTGLATSIHCVAMCGGICLSQTMPKTVPGGGKSVPVPSWKPSLLYNGGRVVSYTVIGGLVGAMGAVVQPSGAWRGVLAVVAGFFMIVMGLRMIGIRSPLLQRLTPRLPVRLQLWLGERRTGAGPFVVGLLNGLMPCGPLQSIQLYALGTGSLIAGAMSMFAFSLGTVPLMFMTGLLGASLGSDLTRRIAKVGAVMVLALGVVMAGRGLALSGIRVFPAGISSNAAVLASGSAQGTAAASADAGEGTDGAAAGGTNADGSSADGAASDALGAAAGLSGDSAGSAGDVQLVEGEVTTRSYPTVTVKKGIPVRLTLKAEKGSINGCNGTLVIPAFDQTVKLKTGDNVIEFTPTETGVIPYSCWMGMVTGEIIVED